MRTRGYEIVEAWHAAVNAGDADRATALVESKVEVAGPRGSGHDRELVREWVGQGISLELRRAFACGQTVVVEQGARWRTESGAEEQLVASVFEVHDSYIARIARHPTLESALEEGCLGAGDVVVARALAPSRVTTAPAVVCRVHHIALATRDLDRLAAFYAAVLGAEFADRRPGPGIITIGGATLLAFEQPEGSLGGAPANAPGEPSSSGRLRHFSLELSDLDGFTDVRERLLARAATSGQVTDFGEHVSLFFDDPDGYFCELTLRKQDGWRPPFETVPHQRR